jgi:hypothetical protein
VTALELARAERVVSGLPRNVVAGQWQAPTLCERWNVPELRTCHQLHPNSLADGVVARFLKSRLVIDRINQVGVDDYVDRSPSKSCPHSRGRPSARPHSGIRRKIALTDNMIHQRDIRRALGIRELSADRLRSVGLSLYAPTIRERGAPAASVWSPPTSTGRMARAPRCKALAKRC